MFDPYLSLTHIARACRVHHSCKRIHGIVLSLARKLMDSGEADDILDVVGTGEAEYI